MRLRPPPWLSSSAGDSAVFSDRAHAAKTVVPLVLFLLGCAWFKRHGDRVDPGYRLCTLLPERYAGTVLWFPGVMAEEVFPDAVVLRHLRFRIRAHGAIPAWLRPGLEVSLRGAFRKDGSLDLVQIREIRAPRDRRLWLNAVSLAALGLVVFFFARAFRLRWDRLTFRPRNAGD